MPGYREIMLYPKLAAFNINWYSGPVVEQKIADQMENPTTGKKGMFTRSGMANVSGDHSAACAEWVRGVMGKV